VGTTPGTNGPLTLGFLTVLQENAGYLGGYLVANHWGRPLEFRLTSAVQPNKVQQILYGGTLQNYICGELIGKALVEKAGVAVQLVVTDREAVLDLRHKVEFPVVRLLTPEGDESPPEGAITLPAPGERGLLVCHPRYPADADAVRLLLEPVDRGFDLGEPFVRIREAMAEARKMGVSNRAA
jgi:hypothetical protein